MVLKKKNSFSYKFKDIKSRFIIICNIPGIFAARDRFITRRHLFYIKNKLNLKRDIATIFCYTTVYAHYNNDAVLYHQLQNISRNVIKLQNEIDI